MNKKVYGDELFIYSMALMEEQDNKHMQNIEDGNINEFSECAVIDITCGQARINGDLVFFSERCIIENKLYMVIPSNFEKVSSHIIKNEIPAEGRPDIIYANAKEKVGISFKLREERFRLEETEKSLNELVQAFQDMNPTYAVNTSVVVDVEGSRIGYLDFISTNGSCDLYNQIFILTLDKHLLVGSFSCLFADMNKWIEVSKQMLHSMKVVC